MSEDATKLLRRVLELPPDERSEFVNQVLDSLDGDYAPDDQEFRAELQRRLDSVADGTAELIDGEQVFREARERIQKRRGA
jgi:putative addiction module component (TIGR02574 family)